MSAACLRPQRLQDARLQRLRKNITAEKLREIEDDGIREVVKLQEDAGLEGITDGELRRDYWHLDFLTQIGGVEFEEGHNPLKWHRQDGVQLEWVPPEVKVHARLTRPHAIQLKDFEFLKSATTHTAKVCIPSPSMMIVQGGENIIDKKVYPDPDKFFTDLSRPMPRRSPISARPAANTCSSTTRSSPSCATTRSAQPWAAATKTRRRWRGCRRA